MVSLSNTCKWAKTSFSFVSSFKSFKIAVRKAPFKELPGIYGLPKASLTKVFKSFIGGLEIGLPNLFFTSVLN